MTLSPDKFVSVCYNVTRPTEKEETGTSLVSFEVSGLCLDLHGRSLRSTVFEIEVSSGYELDRELADEAKKILIGRLEQLQHRLGSETFLQDCPKPEDS